MGPLALRSMRLDQPFAIAGQVPQLPNSRGRHERASQQAMFEQLSQPLNIQYVRLSTRENPEVTGVDQLRVEQALSSTYHGGRQYDPVASITTWVTPWIRTSRPSPPNAEVNDEDVRVCLAHPFPSVPGVRAHATTSSLPISTAVQRSNINSTTDPPYVASNGTGPAGPTDQRSYETCTERQFVVPGRPLASVCRRARMHQARASSADPVTILIVRGGPPGPWVL